jgi:uncharacterized membrane-anchored protein
MIPKLLIAAATLAIFGLVNTEIFKKEELRRNGQPIFLELAPVDPRSLMQGDYMALNFVLAGQITALLPTTQPTPQQAILSLDPKRKATFSRWPNANALLPNEVPFNFKLRNGRPWLGTNAFFFEEGSASRYQNARFGEFRLNNQGEAILVNLVEKLPQPKPSN